MRRLFLAAALAAGCAGTPHSGAHSAPESPPPGAPQAPGTASNSPAEKTPSAPKAPAPQAPPQPRAEKPQAGGLLVTPAGDAVLAEVAGEKVWKSQLVDFFFLFSPKLAGELLSELIKNQMLARELARLQVEIPEQEVETTLKRELEEQRNAVRVQYTGKVSFAEFVQETFSRTEDEYIQDLRKVTRGLVGLARVIRYEQVLEDRIQARMISVRTREKAEEIRKKLEDGADFIALAKKESVAPTAAEGGLQPVFGRGFLVPEVEEVAFRLGEGEVSPILESGKGDSRLYHLLRVVKRFPARNLPYSAVAAEIEQSLKAKAMEQFEVDARRVRAERRYQVKRGGK
jgi:parvulin-like peptidyl-prolyl isomerase